MQTILAYILNKCTDNNYNGPLPMGSCLEQKRNLIYVNKVLRIRVQPEEETCSTDQNLAFGISTVDFVDGPSTTSNLIKVSPKNCRK